MASFFRPAFFICCLFPGLPDKLLKILCVSLAALGKNLETNWLNLGHMCIPNLLPGNAVILIGLDAMWPKRGTVNKNNMLGMEEIIFPGRR